MSDTPAPDSTRPLRIDEVASLAHDLEISATMLVRKARDLLRHIDRIKR